MPRTPDQTRQIFDTWATHYDADLYEGGRGILAGYADSLSTAADSIPVESGTHVLDIGIGTGAFAALLESKGASISGVDPSEKMLEQCRLSHPNYELHLGAFTPIPLSEHHFDVVTASFAFHEVDPSGRLFACQEMFRVLKPDGVLCLLDVMFASLVAREDAQHRLAQYWDPDEDYPLIGDLDTLLRQAGFSALQWQQTAPCHWVVICRKP